MVASSTSTQQQINLAGKLSVSHVKKKKNKPLKNLKKSGTSLSYASKIRGGSQMPGPSLGLNGKQPLAEVPKAELGFLDE